MNNAAVTNFQRNRSISVDGGIVQTFIQSSAAKVTLLFAAHILLALVMIQVSVISTLHALATMVAGFWVAASARKPERVVYVIAYITGSEVLWRMTKAQIFWEFGKYSVVAVLVVAILRSGRFRGGALPFLFFALLLPSLIMPMANVSTEELRGQASFNLSGPFSLMFCVWYFSQIKLPPSRFHGIFLFLAAPIVGIGTVTLAGTFSSSVLLLGTASNFTTSGGFGPNQVSAILGLGVLALFLYLLVEKKNLALKSILLITLLVMAALSAITFSRTGLYSAALSSIAAAFYLVRDPRARMKLLGIVAFIFLLTNFLILPQLDKFTSGLLVRRFQSTSLTGRDKLIRADLQAWADNPIFGAGPGGAIPYRALVHRESAAHTEFTRLVAEHGIFGFISILLLVFIAFQNLRKARTPQAKAISIALALWSFGFMAVTAMRLAAPAVLFGLSSIIQLMDEPNNRIPEQAGLSQ